MAKHRLTDKHGRPSTSSQGFMRGCLEFAQFPLAANEEPPDGLSTGPVDTP